MHRALLLGTGKIGAAIAAFLSRSGDYELTVGDVSERALSAVETALGPRSNVKTARVDATRPEALDRALAGQDSVICALGFHLSIPVADAAARAGVSYFDLTEDVAATRHVTKLAAQARDGQVFMPQCGLAPGFVNVVAGTLAREFDHLDQLDLRVGALPQYPANDLQYNITWSLEGLLNEYINPCETIRSGARCEVEGMDGLEELVIDGARYEAFNTSGGLGTLCESLDGSVRELSYKTIRYPGHRDLMRFFLRGLRLAERPSLARDILEHAIPVTAQDVVIVYVAASGLRAGKLERTVEVRKVYPRAIDGQALSAIQLCTASGVCAMLDLHREGRLPTRGLVRQESVPLGALLENRFGRNFGAASVNAIAPPGPAARRNVA
jgi:saccharopine dehydrogenase-like NADP-dependent oxidoreductase